ncbi:pilin [Acinetobacter indicus]|uniref:pilin n=1 Tax=Acinetobacter indicus TaxID=756892 RepID=UPI000CEBCCAE|nr:pilin [Acinetobacter indicus]
MISGVYFGFVIGTFSQESWSSTNPVRFNSKYLASIDLAVLSGYECSVSLKFKNSNVSYGLLNKTLSFSMTTDINNPATSSWECTSTDIAQKYLPKTCTGI